MRTGTARTGTKRLGEPTLTAADWAEAALQFIAERGVARLKVDALAKRLGVTKGSFYWHFAGRAELLAAALGRWEERATAETIKGLSAVADPRQRLGLMLDAASQPPRAHSLYAALAEAALEPTVQRVLKRVATARIEYLQSCYRELGSLEGEAESKALFAYAAYRGLLQLARETPSVLPGDWSLYPGIVREALLPAASGKKDASSRAGSP